MNIEIIRIIYDHCPTAARIDTGIGVDPTSRYLRILGTIEFDTIVQAIGTESYDRIPHYQRSGRFDAGHSFDRVAQRSIIDEMGEGSGGIAGDAHAHIDKFLYPGAVIITLDAASEDAVVI